MRYRAVPAQNQRTGAAATEMALVLPFLCFVFAVVVDYSRVFCDVQSLEVTAYNGVLYASGFALAAPGSTSPYGTSTTNVDGSVTTTSSSSFTMLTSQLSSNRVMNLQQAWTAPTKP